MADFNLEETCKILNENPIFGKKSYQEKDDNFITNRFIKYFNFFVKDSEIFCTEIILYVYDTNIELSEFETSFEEYEKKFILEHETISEMDFNEVLCIAKDAVNFALQKIGRKFKK